MLTIGNQSRWVVCCC